MVTSCPGSQTLFAAEPPPTDYDLHFRVAGVPVRVHPLFWLITILLGASGSGAKQSLLPVLLWVVAVFVSILVHELGHVAAFRRYGVSSHVVLYSFGGLAVPDSEIGWSGGRRGIRRGPAGDALIAFAGPLAGFVFAALIVGIVALAGYHIEFSSGLIEQLSFEVGPDRPIPSAKLYILVEYLLFVNIVWGIVNLLPVYPLDGGHIARAALTSANPSEGMRQSLMLSILVAGGIALVAAVKWQQLFMALMFGYLAYMSYMALQQISGGGYGGGRGW
jgi:stage IV sporulation protein FB